jgi:Salmonella virulence plasmid 65kDa B protein
MQFPKISQIALNLSLFLLCLANAAVAQTFPAPTISASNIGTEWTITWSAVAGAVHHYDLYSSNSRGRGRVASFPAVTRTYKTTITSEYLDYEVQACNAANQCGTISAKVRITPPLSNTPFNFATEAPASYNYPLGTLSVPSTAGQFVATTQGSLAISNGAASYNVAIDLPPAVRNLKPNLSLSYNSRGGNGLMGVGWSLSGLSTISRCRASIATENSGGGKRFTNADSLCLDGQKLVLASTSIAPTGANYWAAGAEFKTEIDNFNKVVAYSSGASRYYKIFTKDNRILTYGEETSAQNSRIYAPGREGGPITTWALDKVEDAYGNNYTITYERDTANGDYRPLRINFTPESAVVFNYQTRAGQNPWGYDMGYKFMRTKVLDSVVTYINLKTAVKNFL